MMEKRIMAVGMITLLGFLLGIGANLFYANGLPYLTEHFPQFVALLGTSWLLWGAIGAIVFVTGSLIYAFFPDDNPRRMLAVTIIGLAIIDIILIFIMSTQ